VRLAKPIDTFPATVLFLLLTVATRNENAISICRDTSFTRLIPKNAQIVLEHARRISDHFAILLIEVFPAHLKKDTPQETNRATHFVPL
jgi:hypothetical protein